MGLIVFHEIFFYIPIIFNNSRMLDEILSVPHNIVMDLNNVMSSLFIIGDFSKHKNWMGHWHIVNSSYEFAHYLSTEKGSMAK